MKMNSKFIIVGIALLASSAFAQDASKDFGDLVPEHHFSINQQKTSLKDNADISNFKINVSPKKEEFTYKVNSVRTPGTFSKDDFKLTVDRQDGKVSRITSEDYASNADNTGTQGLQTIAMGTDGKVDSLTNCFQDYGFGLLNTKKNKSDFKCMTLNRDVCAYFEKNKIDDSLLEKMNSCSDVFAKFTQHQDLLSEMSQGDHDFNLKSLGLKGGFKNLFSSTPTNFYDIAPDTLTGIANLVRGYGRAVSQCKFLKEKDYLRPEAKAEVKVDDKGEAPAAATKQ